MTTMNPTPTPAETPRTDASQFTVVAYPHPTEPFQVSLEREKGRGLCDADFARTLERELAAAQAELTTLREKLAEEQAGAASMREALQIIRDGVEDAIKGNPSGLMSAGWVHFQCKALTSFSDGI